VQVFIKFVLETNYGISSWAMDIYWKAVDKLWSPNLKATFSDCPSHTGCTLFLFGDHVYDSIPTFGAIIASRIFQTYTI